MAKNASPTDPLIARADFQQRRAAVAGVLGRVVAPARAGMARVGDGLVKIDTGKGGENEQYTTDCEDGGRRDKGFKFCGGKLNMSYIVSAPLHYEGFDDFWTSASCIGQMAAFTDMLMHVLLWVVVLTIDIMMYSYDPVGDGDTKIFMREIQAGVITSTCLVWVGLFLAIIFGILGQPAGKAFPSTVAFVLGGAFASILFSLVYVILLVNWTEAMTSTDTGRYFMTLRQLSLWSLGLKSVAFYYAKANIDFHGACEHESMLKNICRFVM